MLDEGQARIFDRGRDAWDGIWRTVIYAVPEESRGERDRVRRTLAWHGFGPLAAGTWISPHPRLETVRDALAGLSATRMDLLESRALSRAADREMAFRCWDLDSLGRDYVELIRGYEENAQRIPLRGLTATVITGQTVQIRIEGPDTKFVYRNAFDAEFNLTRALQFAALLNYEASLQGAPL